MADEDDIANMEAEEGHPKHEDGCGCDECGSDPCVQPDPIIADIPVDCAGNVGLTVFRGFLGNSTEGGTWRLYTVLGLGDYVLLRDQDIVHQHQSGSGSLIWVRSSQVVRHVSVQTAEALAAEFLEGPIEQRRVVRRPGSWPVPGYGDGGELGDPWYGPASAKPSRCCG